MNAPAITGRGDLDFPIADPRLAGPDGEYDDARRATIIADASAAYRFESNVPPPYYGRPPHIHLRISAKGFKTLVTQHYPVSDKNSAVFDIIIVPSR